MGEELLWGVKNGDLDKVRELIEKKVSTLYCSTEQITDVACFAHSLMKITNSLILL